MAEKRIQFNSIVKSQLPAYVENEFPLVSEFLKQYYISQEYKGAAVDLIQNIDQYIKIDEQTNLNYEVVLLTSIDEFDDVIELNITESPQGTSSFPDSYGLIRINDEVITYTGKTFSSFTGCIRGFSGITEYNSENNQGDLVFTDSDAAEHQSGATIQNLSCIFLQEFLKKSKKQLIPGLSDRRLSSELDQSTFIKQSKDFYSSKGTVDSYKILFKAIYGADVQVIRPKENLFTPSNAENLVLSNFLVESIVGDPFDIENRTLFQGDSYAPIYNVEQINVSADRSYYKLSFDEGYNRDIRVSGVTYGGFDISPKTHIIGTVSAGSSVIDVDSTIGFENSGEIFVKYPNSITQTSGIVSYTSKTITQFLGCTNIVDDLIDGDFITTNNFAELQNDDEEVQVRVGNVLSDLIRSPEITDCRDGDEILIKTVGIEGNDEKYRYWVYNNTARYSISEIVQINTSPITYQLTLNGENYLKLGDKVTLISPLQSVDSTVLDIITPNVVTITTIADNASISLNETFVLQKQLKKITTQYEELKSYQANVQNVYKKKYSDSILVASNSLPSYRDQPLVVDKSQKIFSGTFSGETINITDHGFYTGELVYYTPEKIVKNLIRDDGSTITSVTLASSLFGGDDGGEGTYYVKKVDNNNLKLAKSSSDIFFNKFLVIQTDTSVSDNILELSEFKSKTIEPQKIYREISTPINSNQNLELKTNPGPTGIMINGVESLNYKSKDLIHFGKLENIEVASEGIGFDVINPQKLKIEDSVGTGATGFLAVSGNLRELRIIDSGFDFTEIPTITITGGNGSGARALVSTKLITHSIEFSSNLDVSLDPDSTIGFSTYHKFRDGEEVVYKTFSQQPISGLSTNSTYFASIVDANTIKLHNTINDAISGINTVSMTSFGAGKHELECVNKKSVIDSINIVNSGSGYENKKRSVISSGINTSSDTITISDHDYKDEEIIRYSVGSGNPIEGLSDGTDYYVTVIDKDRFKLSEVSSSNDESLFYRTKQYVNITSTGSEVQYFNYPPISVLVKGPVGVSTVSGIESSAYQAKVQPIFRGEITSVHLSNNGSGYGTNEIINFKKFPNISVESGKDAQVIPVISDGRIVQVVVVSPGRNYTSTPDLLISSDTGSGCILTPILNNGSITEIKIINSGFGYVSGETTIDIVITEDDFKFVPKLQSWRINLFEKVYNSNKIKDDDLVLGESSSEKYGLQCYNLYAPRKLRQLVYSIDQSGDILYGKPDLQLVNSLESEFTDHSPIIGWAYDGNPIYGPYGYSRKNGGVVTLMKSGYRLNESRDFGPPVSKYPLGFFVEDYTYFEVDDDTVLDRNNGRFCVTPDFPNGTYAYFTTINPDGVESSGIFKNYKIPVFPYLIGDNYYSAPIEFNFKKSSNQDDYDIEKYDWCRNTTPYNLREDGLVYPYIYLPNNLSQKSEILSTTTGTITGVSIKNSGDNYKIGDTLNFEDPDGLGSGVSGKVSLLKGKSVSSIGVSITTLQDVEIFPSNKKGSYILESSTPHNLLNSDIIRVAGISTTSTKLEGSYAIKVSSESFNLVGVGTTGVAIGSTDVTGIVTFINVSSNLSNSDIAVNDVLGIGTERVKVLNIDPTNSRFRVLRAVDGTVGSPHSVGETISENSRRFTIESDEKPNYEFKKNKEVYFEPSESVGLGTTSVGIGSVLSFSEYGINYAGSGVTALAVPIKTIYIKGHDLQTGDVLTYSANGGQGIVYNEEGRVGIATTLVDGQQLFVARISEDLIGIATERVGLGTTGEFIGLDSNTKTIFFTEVGLGNTHSFRTNYSNISAEVTQVTSTVTTEENHKLQVGHNVFIDVNPSIATTYIVKYNDTNRRTIVGITTFSSVGVNTSTNVITILDHGYNNGDKIIHTSDTPCQGLDDDGIYYVVRVDDNNLKLSSSYYDATKLEPSIVSISSTSFGEIGLINPPIHAYRSSIIDFDLSDDSLAYINQSTQYSAFKLNFYLDSEYKTIWETDISSSTFSVSRVGKSGLSSNSKVRINIGNSTPQTLYYRLDPIYEGLIPAIKTESIIDKEVINFGSINSKNSILNGQRRVSIADTNFFKFSLEDIPERTSYVSTSSSITYTTDCVDTSGPISSIQITNPGRNYETLPEIVSINSVSGDGADIIATSNNIGRIEKVKINDIGYDFPTDKTLLPSASLPQIIKINTYARFDSISILSNGRGYASAPDLIVLDGETNEQITDIDLNYSLGDNNVTILRNTKGMNNVPPTILPIRNTNGIEIDSVEFNTITKDVTVTLAVGFSTNFPFAVNDKVLIENISVGLGTDGKGYNSENYGYKLFTLTDVTENLGGIGATVTYNLSQDLEEGELPGNVDDINSFGIIVPEKFFPVFDVSLQNGNYLVGETVQSNGKSGIVQSWDTESKTLRVLSKDDFSVGEKIRGLTSELSGTPVSVTSNEVYYNTASSSRIFSGNQTISGFLNDNRQRIQDNFYYQNFSYSLKSSIPFETWNDVVMSLNHPVGYRRFSDLQVETTNDAQSAIVLPSSELSDLTISNDLNSVIDTNCVFDFDIATENNLNFPDVDGRILSTQINFNNKILADYLESIGNRVLSIDDISSDFNSEPRATEFIEIDQFILSQFRSKKYIVYFKDTRFSQERQIALVNLIHDGTNGYINQYGFNSTVDNQLGFFDFAVFGSIGKVRFYPTKPIFNDYDVSSISFGLDDNYLSTGTTSIGGALIDSETAIVNEGSTSTIVSIGNTYHSLKVLVQITPNVSDPTSGNSAVFNSNEFESRELNILHDGTNTYVTEYGVLTTDVGLSSPNFGIFDANLSGSNINVTFTPSAGVGTAIVNSIVVGLSSVSSGISTLDMKHARLESRTTNIASSPFPSETVIAQYDSQVVSGVSIDRYDAGYFNIQVHDTTNDRYEFLEYLVVDDFVVEFPTNFETYDLEYGNVQSHVGLGTFGSKLVVDPITLEAVTQIEFTPIPGIDVTTNVFSNAFRVEDDLKQVVDLLNGTVETGYAKYIGTRNEIKRDFELTHKGAKIFEREFDGDSPDIVSISDNTIIIPNHFYVSGEAIKYEYTPRLSGSQPIGIAQTTFPETGTTTDTLPSEGIFAIKVDDNTIQLARSAEDALRFNPIPLDITSLGISGDHKFVASNQNQKVLVSIDNIIQSPIVSTAVTTILDGDVVTTDDVIYINDTTGFFSADVIKIESASGNELMKIQGVGVGSETGVRVRRGWLGTSPLVGISAGDLVTKITGNYNIVGNTLTFSEAPYGNTPIGTATNPPDERDYVGITTSSSFQGRTFLRNAQLDTTNETYYNNYIIDDISDQFNGLDNEFTLKSEGSDIVGVANRGAIVLINDVYQPPGDEDSYTLSESSGISSISFVGSSLPTDALGRDVGISSFPTGGIIVAVGSTEGFGYQPLVSAGGTATVSGIGTISAISIGNSGSGYRSGVQTVNVSVTTSSLFTADVVAIGTAIIVDGHVTSVDITNPGSGYTTTNPPYVIFDDPLSYSNLPLEYKVSGIGSAATIDIVVSQDSTVLDFEIKNTGYNYEIGDILTIPTGGATGVPTTSSFSSSNQFEITVDNIFDDKFAAWTVGVLETFDDVSEYIDGINKNFPIIKNNVITTILAEKGSKIELDHLLLIFVNNVLQVPKISYEFEGGSLIKFKEAPKIGDTIQITFYKGSGEGIDVIQRDVIESIKDGDTVKLNADPEISSVEFVVGVDGELEASSQTTTTKVNVQQDFRTVTEIIGSDICETLPYFGPGTTRDILLERPLVWCRQTEDRIINGKEVSKDRVIYEPVINPVAYLLNTVSAESTTLYVDRVRPAFDFFSENGAAAVRLGYQKFIDINSHENAVGASATATVSPTGTVTSINIVSGGSGYTEIPEVSIASTDGIINSSTATATATLTNGEVTSISINNAGIGYTSTNPPLVLIAPPADSTETVEVLSYAGDSGVIVGLGTTTGDINNNAELIFEFHIPYNSELRDASYVGTPITLSGISTGDYFATYNTYSVIPEANGTLASYDTTASNIIGFTTEFVDCVYQAKTVEVVSRNIGGITTDVVRVNAIITGVNTVGFSSTSETFDSTSLTFDNLAPALFSGGISTSNYFGDFSWGKISIRGRRKDNEYTPKTLNGSIGLSSSPSVIRSRYIAYTDNTQST